MLRSTNYPTAARMLSAHALFSPISASPFHCVTTLLPVQQILHID